MSKKAPKQHWYWDARKWGKRGREIAPAVLSILVQRAREGETITYGDLAAILEQRYRFPQTFRKTFYGSPVGLVGYVLQDLGKEWGETLPPLNVIVINKAKKLPGKGADPLLRDYFKAKGERFTQSLRRVLAGEAQQAVFDYGHRWAEVAQALGVDVLKPTIGKLPGDQLLKLPKVGHGDGLESAQHKALKLWVKNNPALFKVYGKFAKGANEILISSGDRLDVLFENDQQRLAVEVKPSHASNDELKRGVFQAVKYRAVMRAEQRALLRVPNAQALLVTIIKPDRETKALLKRLQVEHVLAPKYAED
jgi:hypothetical protein